MLLSGNIKLVQHLFSAKQNKHAFETVHVCHRWYAPYSLPRLMQPRRKAEKTHGTNSHKEPTKRDTFTAITSDTLYTPQ